MNAASRRCDPRRRNNLPTVCPRHFQIAVSMLSAPVSFACLFSRSRAAPSELYFCHARGPLQLLALSPIGCKNPQNSAALVFPANGFGEVLSLFVPLCALFSLAFLHDHSSFASAPPLICFSPKPRLPPFYLLQCGLLLAVRCVLSVFRLISGVSRIIW